MASARGRGKDGKVTEEQLRAAEYELQRTKHIEENEKRKAQLNLDKKQEALLQASTSSNPPPKKPKAPSCALEKGNGGPVLRSSRRNDCDRVDPGNQPSNDGSSDLDDEEVQKRGRKITQKLNIYSRLNKPKIKIPLNEFGQPVGADATEFANFIGTLVRKHIPPVELDWRDVHEEQKFKVWDHLRAFYEVDSTAMRYVYSTSHIKWKEWKSDLRKAKFDASLTDEQLMKRRDKRISETDWKSLIDYWRSLEFEARSIRAKENRAKSTVSHTAGSKSYARVSHEMVDELGYAPRRDEVYIRTHTRKSGHPLSQAVPIIKQLEETAATHPELKEKSIEDGDLYSHVCGIKEPRGRVRVLGLGPTPQDVGTPGTRGKMTTRVLVEMEARRQAEQRMDEMQQHMQQMQQQLDQMKEMLLASQGGQHVETPNSQHGSNSRLNSRVECELEDGEEIHVHRRVAATRVPQEIIPTHHQDESLIGQDVLLYAWTGPETPVAKATILSINADTVVGGGGNLLGRRHMRLLLML